MTRSIARKCLLCMLALGCVACADEAGNARFNKLNAAQFRTEVYPVLLRDCGFPTCHGSTDRFFQVWGPGRGRLDPTKRAFDLTTGAELSTSYQLALSMVDGKHPERSLLLRKPLAREAGGAGHEGVDKFGRNVYRSANDQGYLAIARWVFSQPVP